MIPRDDTIPVMPGSCARSLPLDLPLACALLLAGGGIGTGGAGCALDRGPRGAPLATHEARGTGTTSAPRTTTVSQTDRAVTHGAPVDGDPAVVALVYADTPTDLRCTGTLIAPRVVLTAAHCGAQHDPTALAVRFGAALASASPPVNLLDAVAHPDYADTAGHDLALLLLAEPAPTGTAPIPLATAPHVAAPPPVALRLVGYGVTDATATDDDRKREGQTRTTEVHDRYVVLGADPSLPCRGDSGGPALLDPGDGEQLAAVISRGDEGCGSYSKATRVDVHVAGFIQPYLDATAPGSAADGELCLYDDQCTGGLCLQAADEPRLQFCSRPCEGDRDCPAPLICGSDAGGAQDTCRYALPSPGAPGAPCTGHADCLRGECLAADQAPGGERLCAYRCVAGRGDCLEGFACTHLGGVDFFCLPEPPASGCGCNATAGGRGAGPGPGSPATPTAPLPGGVLLAALGLLLALRRRRRPRTRG